MYAYGLSIGMDFIDIYNILTSDTGKILTSLLESNIFDETTSYSQIQYAFDYFKTFPYSLLKKFDISHASDGTSIKSPLREFQEMFEENIQKNPEKSFTDSLYAFARNPEVLPDKLKRLDQLRNKTIYNQEAKELYNQLIDVVSNYLIDINKLNFNHLDDLRVLSEGAEEMRVLGQIFSANQGIKTDIGAFLNQLNNIERAVYNHTDHEEDMIDFTKFIFDKDYRQEQILKYEEQKHSINILEAPTVNNHTFGYLETLATALEEAKRSYIFRSMKQNLFNLSTYLKHKKESDLIRGYQNYLSDKLRNEWLLNQKGIVVMIPKGNFAFNSQGEEYLLKEDTPIKLGTDWGNATFKRFVETQVIPDLQEGKIGLNSMGIFVSNNNFIKNLTYDISTNTPLGNPIIVSTLPINMMPRTDQERAILNNYISEFNKLEEYRYEYQYTSRNEEGIEIEHTFSMPIIELFTYYSMIAYNWKNSENSLVPILEYFQNKGIIKEFHDFEAYYDKSGIIDSIQQEDYNDILPYIVQYGNPYSAFDTYIKARNRNTNQIQIMRYNEADYMEDDDGSYKARYYGITKSANIAYFPTGQVQSITNTVKGQLRDNKQFTVSYNIESGDIAEILVNLEVLNLPELTKIPVIKENNIKVVDMNLLKMIIEDKLFTENNQSEC